MAEPYDLDAVLRALTKRTAAEHGETQRAITGALESFGLSAATDQSSGTQLNLSRSGLVLPQASRPVPLDYIGVYITLSQYTGSEDLGLSSGDVAEAMTRLFCSQAPRSRLVELLVTLNRGLSYPELVDAYLDVHRQGLDPVVAERFDNVLKSERSVPAAPQTILAALRYVLSMADVPLDPKSLWGSPLMRRVSCAMGRGH